MKVEITKEPVIPTFPCLMRTAKESIVYVVSGEGGPGIVLCAGDEDIALKKGSTIEIIKLDDLRYLHPDVKVTISNEGQA